VWLAVEVAVDAGDSPARLDLAALAGDRKRATQLDRPVLGDPQLAGLEGELGVLAGVEELGGEEVALQLLVGDSDAADVDRSLQAGAGAAAPPGLV
jgi:hypothetical protein